MKKIFVIFMLLFAGLFFSATVQAKVYQVRSGDTLSRIAQKEMGNWKKYRQIKRIKNGEIIRIAKPNIIKIGWQLWIPELRGKEEPRTLEKITEKQAGKALGDLWEKKSPKKPAKKAENIAGLVAEAKKSKKSATIASKSDKKVNNLDEAIEIAQAQARARKACHERRRQKKVEFEVRNPFEAVDTLNLYYGQYGAYPGEDREREGWNFGAKLQWRPFKFKHIGYYDDLGFGSIRLGLGAKYGTGSTEVTRESDGRYSEYDFEYYGLSFSSQYKRMWDEWDLELGVLWHETDGRVPTDNRWSHQENKLWDLGLLYKNEWRRLHNKKWFPEFNLSARYQRPFDTDYRDSRGFVGDEFAYDEHWFQIGGNLWVYDFYLTRDRAWRITPGFNAYLGHHWGKESGYVKFGPMAKLAAFEQEIIELSILNPKKYFEDNGSRIYWFNLNWKIDDTIRAIYASQIEDYEPDDQGRYERLKEISSNASKSNEGDFQNGRETLEEGVYVSNWGGETPTG